MTEFAPPATLRAIAMTEADMKRDDELIRKLMLDLEADPRAIVDFTLTRTSTEEEIREYYHLKLLADAGYLEVTGKFGGVLRITNAGHDFLAVLGNETIWTKARAKAAEAVPRYGLKLLAEIGNELIRQALRDKGLLP